MRVSQELLIRQAHLVHEDFIGPYDGIRRKETLGARKGYHVVLIDTVTGNAKAADQLPV